MDSFYELSSNLEALKKQMHMKKKEKMAKNGFLHSGEYAIMKHIAHYHHERGKNPTLVVLSQLLGITQATVTPLVERLVQKGLVIKEVSDTDKRAKLISLTDKGMEFLHQNQRADKEHLHKLLACLGEEDTQHLIRILQKITANMEDMEV